MEIKAFLNNLFRRKSYTTSEWRGFGNLDIAAKSKEGYIKEGYSGSSTVYSIVDIISQTFAAAPFVMYKVKDKKSFERYKVATKGYNPTVQAIKLKSAAMDEIDGHPLLDLLNNPNKIQGGFDFKVHLNASRDITGDAFIYVNRGLTNGDPLELKVLPSQYINLKTSTPYTVEGYQLNMGTVTDYTTDEVIHWRYQNLDYDTQGQHLFGQSPLKAAANDYTLSASKEGKKAAANAYKNRGAGGVLSRNEDITWSPEQRDALNSYLDDVVNGNENRNKVRAMNAKVSWVQMAMSAGDMQLIEGLAMSKEELCNVYNFPVHLLSAASGTFNNVDAANKYLVTKTTYGRWVSFRDFVNQKLLPMFKDGHQYYFDFDISLFPEVQDDQKKLVEVLNLMPITSNEFREYLGWEPLKIQGMDTPLVKTDKIPIDQLTASLGDNISSDIEDLNKSGYNDY